MKIFDVFSGIPDTNRAIWQGAFEGLAQAISAMNALERENAGRYFVYDLEHAEVVGVINELGPKLVAHKRHEVHE